MSVGVFVYGDVGRSPRMQNHAVELSKDYEVYLMGYQDSPPRNSIVENENIHLVDLQIGRLQHVRKLSFYLYAIVRIILQVLQVLYLLGWKYRHLKLVLVQVTVYLFRILHPFPTCLPYGWLLLYQN